MMKILFLIENLWAGGKERRFVQLLTYLNTIKEIYLGIIITEKDIFYDQIKKTNIPIYIIERKTRYDPTLFYKIFQVVNEFKPDVIHSWGIMTTIYSIPSKILFKKPLVGSIIADAEGIFAMPRQKRLLFYLCCLFSDLILSNSEAGLIAYNLKSNRKSRVIYNGIDLGRFFINKNKDEIKKKYGINTPYLIIMVASASKKKNYDLFFDIAKEISLKRKDITFLGIGNGQEFDRLKKKIFNEKIENANLIQARPNIEEIMYASDIGILFSENEGISNSVAEYMACGLPVISTDVSGGTKEIIENCKSGYIFRKEDKELIINKILELIDNKAIRIELGKRGAEIIKDRFSLEFSGMKYLNLYVELINKKSRNG